MKWLTLFVVAGCAAQKPSADPCVDDPTLSFSIRPPEVRMKPGDRLTFDYEVRSRKGTATAEASFAEGALEHAGTNAVRLTAPGIAGTYSLVVSRVGCPMDRATATITVEPLASLGRAAGNQPGAPTGLAWSPDGTTLAVTGRAGVWLFRPDLSLIDSARIPHQGKTTVSFSPDGTLIAVGGDAAERTWLLETSGLKPRGRVGVANGSAGHLFSRDGTELYLHEGDRLRAFSVSTGAMRDLGAISAAPGSDAIARLEFGPFGSVLVTAPPELRELSTGRRMTNWASPAASGVAISRTGAWAFLSTGLRRPFAPQSLTVSGTPTGPGGGFFTTELSPDGTVLAVGEAGGVSIYRADGDTPAGIGGATLMNSPGPVLDVAWSPDGSRLAIAGNNRVHVLTRAQLGLP